MSTCRRCHRSIRDSWAISPSCLKREREKAIAEAAEGYSDEQVIKATALLKSKGVEQLAGGLYLTRPSERGRPWYQTTSWSCTCSGGLNGRFCYHRLAVSMQEAVWRVGGLTGPFAPFKTTTRKAA